MTKLLLAISIFVSGLSYANANGYEDIGKAIVMSTSADLVVSICSEATQDDIGCLFLSTYLYTTITIVILAEKVVLERGTDGILNSDTEGYIDDAVLLEALDIIREDKPEKTQNMSDVQIIELVQKESGKKAS